MIDDTHRYVDILLDPLQNIQATSSTIPFDRVRRPGNMLEFFEDKLRHDQRSLQESRLADIGDTTINDHARIENFRAAGLPRADPQGLFIASSELRTFPQTEDNPQVGTDSIQEQSQWLHYLWLLHRQFGHHEIA